MIDFKKNYIQFDNKSNGIANSLILMACSILLLPVLFAFTSMYILNNISDLIYLINNRRRIYE